MISTAPTKVTRRLKDSCIRQISPVVGAQGLAPLRHGIQLWHRRRRDLRREGAGEELPPSLSERGELFRQPASQCLVVLRNNVLGSGEGRLRRFGGRRRALDLQILDLIRLRRVESQRSEE